MKKILLALLTLLVCFSGKHCFGQNNDAFLEVNYSEIEKFVNQNEKVYNELMARFMEGDTLLAINELKYIFYGTNYSSKYQYKELSREASQLIKEEKYEEGLKMCREELKVSPTSLDILFREWICLKELELNADTCEIQISQLFYLILSTGDGKTAKTAFKVMEVPDEYIIIYNVFGANVKAQALIGNCDVMTLYDDDPDKTWDVYFDITLHLEKLSKLFGDFSSPKKAPKKSKKGKKAKASASIQFE